MDFCQMYNLNRAHQIGKKEKEISSFWYYHDKIAETKQYNFSLIFCVIFCFFFCYLLWFWNIINKCLSYVKIVYQLRKSRKLAYGYGMNQLVIVFCVPSNAAAEG